MRKAPVRIAITLAALFLIAPLAIVTIFVDEAAAESCPTCAFSATPYTFPTAHVTATPTSNTFKWEERWLFSYSNGGGHPAYGPYTQVVWAMGDRIYSNAQPDAGDCYPIFPAASVVVSQTLSTSNQYTLKWNKIVYDSSRSLPLLNCNLTTPASGTVARDWSMEHFCAPCTYGDETTEEGCTTAGWYWNYTGSNCQQDPWYCENEPDCEVGWNWNFQTCSCFYSASPVLIDTSGNGFNLTSGPLGVDFDLDGDGVRQRLAWTAADSDDAWLALDRDGNGLITTGAELFGNFTEQPDPPPGEEKQGFLALAQYDKPAGGGNGDGMISNLDAIFSSLRLWRDANHDGFSQASELKTLNGLGLKSIDLDHRESKRTDEHGNQFKYRAMVRDKNDARLGRWAWDVFLVAP